MLARSFRIGPWQVCPASNEILCGSARLHLEPKTMDVLVLLAERAGEVVPKEELLDRVWPETFVSDGTLFRVISELRRTLGDDSRAQRFVQTVPKRGYRLVAAVTFEAEMPEAGAAMLDSPERAMPAEPPARPTRRSFVRHGLTAAVIASSILLLIAPWKAGQAPATRTIAAAPAPDARIAYLEGRVFDERADCRSYARARAAFETALQRDSGFEKPYGELIDAYLASAVLGCIPPGVSAARTRELLSAAGRWQDAPWYGIRRALAPFSLPIRLLPHPQARLARFVHRWPRPVSLQILFDINLK
jgi:DNA-binding winged helix-turn-helix (wHTH) protein